MMLRIDIENFFYKRAAMYIDLLILGQIEQAPKYGYEIKKNIQKDLGHLIDVNHNLLYPALRRFTQMGAVIKKINEQEGKPHQNVYYITDTGKSMLSDLIKDFTANEAKNDVEFLIRVSFFNRIEAEERMRILNLRKDYLSDLMNKDVIKDPYQGEDSFYMNQVLAFTRSHLKKELEWIEELKRIN
jgi:DNA-binding PadR family transcriptional regulator